MGEIVYGASCSGSLYALDKRSGEVRWSYDTAQDGASAQFHGDPVVVGDLLVIPSDARPAGFVYAFELATGTVRWKTPVAPGGVVSHLLHAGSTVIGVSLTGRLMAFDLETGQERWALEEGTEGDRLALNTNPALADGRVYYGGPDGRVVAVEAATGEVVWTVDLGARPNTAVVVDGDHMLVGAADRHLYRLARRDGAVVARLELPGVPVGTPILAGESLYLVGSGGLMAAVDRRLEGIDWTYSEPAGWSSFQPLVEEDRVVVGSEDGVLFAFALDDGRVLWRDELSGTLRGIGRAAGVYFVGTFQGRLYAWAPDAASEAVAADPLSWLVGSWRGGLGEGSLIEEIWSDREGDDRMGMFRLVEDGTVRFYEFMTIGYEAEGPVLRIKHFDKGLVGWEEREQSEVFHLVESRPRHAVFAQHDPEVPTRLIYALEAGGELTVVLEKDQPDGTTRSEFRFDRP